MPFLDLSEDEIARQLANTQGIYRPPETGLDEFLKSGYFPNLLGWLQCWFRLPGLRIAGMLSLRAETTTCLSTVGRLLFLAEEPILETYPLKKPP
jgi:hypothetical protein